LTKTIKQLGLKPGKIQDNKKGIKEFFNAFLPTRKGQVLTQAISFNQYETYCLPKP
jgi:hypothetical protein